MTLESPWTSVLYPTGKLLFSVIFRTLWRMKVRGLENVPAKGAAIVAANHFSLADPPLLGGALPRRVHYMAKKELFEVPILGWFIHRVNAFPLNREEGDIGALRTAEELLKKGEMLLMFPEGTRSRAGILRKPKPGVGMLAARSRAQVVPTLVHNTNQLKRGKPVTVWFGRPLIFEGPESRDGYQAFAERVMAEIASMKESLESHG